MNQVWLRDYEKVLSSNRRSMDLRPSSADISNNRIKKGRPAKIKKRRDNFTSEVDVARQLRGVGTDVDIYDIRTLEKDERVAFQRKLEDQQRKNSSKYKMQVSFKKLSTFDEFKNAETRRQEFIATGDSEIFHSLYPDIDHHMSSPKAKSILNKNNKSKISPMNKNKNGQTFQLSCVTSEDLNVRPERPTAQFEISIAKQALQLWKAALTTLRQRGQNIVYEDVSMFSKKWKRSASLQSFVIYLCTLLGLKSNDPTVAQRSLFRELYSLLQFFREANPLTIPKRRISKANNYYAKTITELKSGEADSFELNILGWIEAMQAVFSIILEAKTRHEILNANFDEKLCEIEAQYADMDPTSTTPFKHLQRKGARNEERMLKGETIKQHQHRIAKLSPTGTWSTRLTSPAQMAAEDAKKEMSMCEGELSAFDSTAIQSFLDVSHSVNIPLDDVLLEYSPDKSVTLNPETFSAVNSTEKIHSDSNASDSNPHDDFVNRSQQS